MEQILMSSPGSHADWDGDQNSLGFMLLDSNDPVTPGGNEEIDERQLHFEEGDRNVMSLSLGEIFSENALNLDDLFRSPQYAGVEQVFPWDQDAELPTSKWESQLSCSQNIPQSKQDQHLEESVSPCSTTSPAVTGSALPWARESTDIPESTPVCTDLLITGDSTGHVKRETGVDTLTQETLSPQTLTHTPAQGPQHVYTPDESAVTHRTPQLDHTLTGVCLEPAVPPGETSTPLVCEGVSAEPHIPQLSPGEDASQQTQQQISEICNSCVSPPVTPLADVSEYTGQTVVFENMTESEICQATQESPDEDLMPFEGRVELRGHTEASISHHTETAETNAPTLSSLEEYTLTDQSSQGQILSILTARDVECEATVMQVCEGDNLFVSTTEVHTPEPLLEDTYQVLSEQTPEGDAGLDNIDVGEMPETVSEDSLILIEGDLPSGNKSETLSEHSAKTEIHEQACLHSEEIQQGDVLTNKTPDKSISEHLAEEYAENIDTFSEATYKSELYQHLPEVIVAEHTPEDILPGWIFEVNPSEGDSSGVFLMAEPYEFTPEVDMSSEHVPGAETPDRLDQHNPDGDSSAVEEIQHVLRADSFPEQTQAVEEVFSEDVIKAGSSPDSSSIAEINPSDKRDTADFKNSDTISTTSKENTHAHISNSENIKVDIIALANSENIEDLTTLQLENCDINDASELENSIKSPELNVQNSVQNLDVTHNLEISQTYGTEHKDRTDLLLKSENSHSTEDSSITRTTNTEKPDDSDTFSTNHSDHLHAPNTETTTEPDTTCPDHQTVDGCESRVEPMIDSISMHPQEKPCTLNPPESGTENGDSSPASDSCPPDTRPESVGVCAEDLDASLPVGDLPLLLTCAGDQPNDVGGASGQACPANQIAAPLEGHQRERESPLTFTQASSEEVTEAQSHGSSPTEGTIQQLMEEKDMLTLPEYGSLDPDPPDNLEVRNAGPIPVAMGSTEPLRAVFQALDQDGDGFVRMEEFLEFAAAYGAEQVRIVTFL